MAQFHVYRLPGGQLVMDLQSDLIDPPTRVVAPLFALSEGPPRFPRMEPVFVIGDEPHALHTGEMAALPRQLLTRSIVDLSSEEDAIRRALDMVFSGF